jgi:hypothetical protein
MNTSDDTAAGPFKVPRQSVQHRRNSRLSIRIPQGRKPSEANGPSLESIQEKFKLILPHEPEIIRKLGFKIERALLPFRQAKSKFFVRLKSDRVLTINDSDLFRRGQCGQCGQYDHLTTKRDSGRPGNTLSNPTKAESYLADVKGLVEAYAESECLKDVVERCDEMKSHQSLPTETQGGWPNWASGATPPS